MVVTEDLAGMCRKLPVCLANVCRGYLYEYKHDIDYSIVRIVKRTADAKMRKILEAPFAIISERAMSITVLTEKRLSAYTVFPLKPVGQAGGEDLAFPTLEQP